MSLIDEIRNDIEGVKLLTDWFGEGGEPVSQLKAEHRAHMCAFGDGGKACHLNVAPNWWNLHANSKSAIAETIRAELELKHHMDLSVSCEDSLHLCAACGCCLRLAVFAPLKRLKEHTTQDQLGKMPRWCWKKNEILAG